MSLCRFRGLDVILLKGITEIYYLYYFTIVYLYEGVMKKKKKKKMKSESFVHVVV